VGAGLIQATTAVQLAVAAGQAQGQTLSALASSVFASAMSIQSAMLAATNAGQDPVAAAVAAVQSDPTATTDFSVFIDPSDPNVAAGADTLASGIQSWAMLNNNEQVVVPIYSNTSLT
jgi:hypothetical protein